MPNPHALNGLDEKRDMRSLAEIEALLVEAEVAYADADSRLKQAELDRIAALDTINGYQMDFDEAIARVRGRSISGSLWSGEAKEAEVAQEPLCLDEDDEMDKPTLVSKATAASVKAEFWRLKNGVAGDSGDPILKVALGNGQRS